PLPCKARGQIAESDQGWGHRGSAENVGGTANNSGAGCAKPQPDPIPDGLRPSVPSPAGEGKKERVLKGRNPHSSWGRSGQAMILRRIPVRYPVSTCAVALAAGLLATPPAIAQVVDFSKYPDLKGQWERTGPPNNWRQLAGPPPLTP